MSFILRKTAVTADQLLNRMDLRAVRVRKGKIEIIPRPLVTRSGVVPTEALGGEMGNEQVDGWQVNVPIPIMEKLFGTNWQSAISPLTSDWELSEHNGPWRKVRVSEQPSTDDGGRVVFKVLALGYGVF